MDQREVNWHLKKVGFFSSSKLGDLMSASGDWIKGNKTYLYEIQAQRESGEPAPPIFAKTMEIGVENEPVAIAWARKNTDLNILHCDADFTEKLFMTTDYGFGASHDAFIMSPLSRRIEWSDTLAEDELIVFGPEIIAQVRELLEVKTLAGRDTANWMFSPTVPFEDKRKAVFEEHKWQMAGQLMLFPNVDKIRLLKYKPQIDSNPWDTVDVLDPSRGLLFEFDRSNFKLVSKTGIDDMLKVGEARVRYADAFLKSGKNIDKINELPIDY